MSGVAAGAAIGLAGAVGLLLVTLVVMRMLAGALRRRRAVLRPQLERELARYLAGEDDTSSPRVAPGGLPRSVFRQVALDALAELRGHERERLTVLLEEHGLVADAVRDLEARAARRRRAAADTLALIRSAGAEESLEAHLEDHDSLVRLACARALAELGRARAGADLALALSAEPEASLGAAADAMLALGANQPAGLGPLLADGSSAVVQGIAAAVAGELRLLQHAPALRALIDSPVDEVAARAARGLGLIGDSEAVGLLCALVADPRRIWFVRAAAVRALGAIGDPSAAKAIRGQLDADEWPLQANAAGALAALGPTGVQALRTALQSPNERVRAHARVALEAVQ